jgi:hypothetical protein
MRASCYALVLLLAVALARTAVLRANSFSPDFEYFYKGGTWLFHHGSLDPGYDVSSGGQVIQRGSIEWYLPFISRLMTLIAWLPPRPAGWIWLAANALAMLATLRMAGRHLVGLPPQDWPVTQVVPLILLGVFWYVEFWLNQTDALTLALLVGSFVCWQSGRSAPAGLWLGIAVLIKVTPVLLVVWFALKRQFRVVAVAAITALLAGPVADAIVFGPAEAVDVYRAWYDHAVVHGSHRNLILTQTEMDWRNQGMGAVLSRWLHPTNYTTHYDNDPRMSGSPIVATINVCDLSRETVAWVTLGLQGLSLAGLLWLARRPAKSTPVWRLRLEWALFVLAMLWFMPVMRAYHLVWALPAISLLGAVTHYLGHRHWWSAGAMGAMLGLVAAQVALNWTLPQAAGVLLWVVALVALPMVVMLLWLQRNPSAIPEDYYFDGSSPAPSGFPVKSETQRH